MPNIASANIPSPKSWDEFEEITLSAAKARWHSSNFFRHGRQGQRQDGVDIWGDDENGRHIGIQCKNTIDGITLETIETEIGNAASFTPRLDHLYIATTAKRDAPLQRSVRNISQERTEAGQFKVDLLFWDDISQDLASDESAFFRHYPQFKAKSDPAKEHDKRLFDELTTLLNSDGVIGFLDEQNMAGFSFRSSSLNSLFKFHLQWKTPEREFLNPDLEALRKTLWSKANDYLATIGTETFSTRNPGFITVPPEWELEDPTRFLAVVQKLHSLAEQIVSLHGDIVRTGRAYLTDRGP